MINGYQPRPGPANPKPPQGGSATVPARTAIEEVAHLSRVEFRARCGADETDQATVHESAIGATERPLCPRCVALVFKERDEAQATSLRFLDRLVKANTAIAKARKHLRIDGLKNSFAYRALGRRTR